MPRGPEKVEGMEKPKRARKRKPETSQGGPEATGLQFSGGQGVHREVESDGHEEKSVVSPAPCTLCQVLESRLRSGSNRSAYDGNHALFTTPSAAHVSPSGTEDAAFCR
jgi:hypothetical protein